MRKSSWTAGNLLAARIERNRTISPCPPRFDEHPAIKRHRKINYRLVKIHRSYSVEEVAALLRLHKNTVRAWIKAGLATSDLKRPILILGSDLAGFLRDREAKRKKPCRLGEIYCVRCRSPKRPAVDMVEYERVTDKIGKLTAICPDCACLINQRVSSAKFEGK